jgi:hypothetical protein
MWNIICKIEKKIKLESNKKLSFYVSIIIINKIIRKKFL